MSEKVGVRRFRIESLLSARCARDDWGGKDVLDHVEGLKMLEKDSRIDSTWRAVIGRSYGGYMTLTLASRNPDLWRVACDMFGPYDARATRIFS